MTSRALQANKALEAQQMPAALESSDKGDDRCKTPGNSSRMLFPAAANTKHSTVEEVST